MEDRKVPGVKEFKYLESTVHESGSCEREVKKRVQAGWNGWRKVLGVICGRSLPARVKGKVYNSVVRPAMVYGLAVAVTKNIDHQWLYYQWMLPMDHHKKYGPPLWTTNGCGHKETRGSRRDENVEVCYGSDEKRQD